MSPLLASTSVACRSAFRAGGLVGFVARSSERSPSGVALVAVFSSPAAAGRFATRWSVRLHVGVKVRRLRGPEGAARWGVSLPVAADVPFGYWAGGTFYPPPHMVPVRGGVRGLPAAVAQITQAIG